ncbi:MAG: Ig-like domain-containing protein [Burkholderiaceae bacterium]
MSDAAGNASPASAVFTITVDGTGPLAPVIDPVAGDDLVIFTEAQAGFAVTGSAEAGSRLTLTWGDTVRTAQADGAGRFRLDYGSGELPADGTQPLSITATDSFGNVGAAGCAR